VATKKTSKSKDVVVYDEKQLALYAEQEAQREKAGPGNTMSIRNGKFSYQGSDLGSTINVVILGYSFVNAYYDRPFDPDSPVPPACFAISDSGEDMKPHADAPNPQGDDDNGACLGCWANAFESDNRGKGKACKNTRRLAFISADELKGDLDDVEVAFLSLPPMSGKAWKGYVNQIAKALQRPVFSMVTTMSFDDNEDYPKLEFKAADRVPPNLISKMVALRDSVKDQLMAPFNTEGYESPDKASSKKKGGSTPARAPARKTAPGGKKSKFAK
jgi:hypothetical protein